ncbi:MAG: hypothetical protein WKF47_06425 [Geodermatophilaceae bacterium]
MKMKKLEFFQRQLDAKDPQVFRASVLEVEELRPRRLSCPDVLLTGLIHISSLTDDFYVFQSAAAKADRPPIASPISQSATICASTVARVDVFKRQVDFAIAEDRPATRGRSRRR